MHKWKFERSNIIYFFYAVVLSWLFFVFAKLCYFSDSEIWLLTLSQKVFNIQDVITIYYKWSFHTLIYLFSHWAPTEIDVYLWARTGCAAIALFSLLVSTFIYTGVFSNRKMFFPLLIFLLSSSLFFNQGFRIRADIFSYFFHILNVWFIYSCIDKKITWRAHALSIALNLLLISTSPKMIYFFIAQVALGFLLARVVQKNKKQFLWFIWQTHLSCLCLAFLLLVASNFIPSIPNGPYILSLALQFYLKKFDPILFTPQPMTADAFWYFTHFLQANFFHTLALLTTLVIVISRGLGLTPAMTKPQSRSVSRDHQLQSAFGLYSLLLLILALLHNDKLPFFLAPMLVPVSAYCFLFASRVLENWNKRYFQTGLICVMSILCYRAFVQYDNHHKMNTNFFQKMAIKSIDRYKATHPGIKIYDVVGLLPRKTDIYAFVGPGEEDSKENIMKQLRQEKPDIILYVFKALLLEPQLTDYLMANMIPLEQDVWARGTSVTIARSAELFQRVRVIKGNAYWLFPAPKEKYIYDLTNSQLINHQVLKLDEDFKPTNTKQRWIAVPQGYLSLGFSDFAPLALLHSPNNLFRYDTGY